MDEDWRLQAELDVPDTRTALGAIVARLRGDRAGVEKGVVGEIEAAVPDDVVITHDGKLLFAYAADQATLAAARGAIEGVLARESIAAVVRVSCWDDELDQWRQTDPPLSPAERGRAEAARRDAERVETRTLVASAGRLVRGELEQSMSVWAERLGVECEIVEHPHLLSTQIAFTVTGPRRKLDEFASGLRAEE
jgi:hypothetical protein